MNSMTSSGQIISAFLEIGREEQPFYPMTVVYELQSRRFTEEEARLCLQELSTEGYVVPADDYKGRLVVSEKMNHFESKNSSSSTV